MDQETIEESKRLGDMLDMFLPKLDRDEEINKSNKEIESSQKRSEDQLWVDEENSKQQELEQDDKTDDDKEEDCKINEQTYNENKNYDEIYVVDDNNELEKENQAWEQSLSQVNCPPVLSIEKEAQIENHQPSYKEKKREKKAKRKAKWDNWDRDFWAEVQQIHSEIQKMNKKSDEYIHYATLINNNINSIRDSVNLFLVNLMTYVQNVKPSNQSSSPVNVLKETIAISKSREDSVDNQSDLDIKAKKYNQTLDDDLTPSQNDMFKMLQSEEQVLSQEQLNNSQYAKILNDQHNLSQFQCEQIMDAQSENLSEWQAEILKKKMQSNNSKNIYASKLYEDESDIQISDVSCINDDVSKIKAKNKMKKTDTQFDSSYSKHNDNDSSIEELTSKTYSTSLISNDSKNPSDKLVISREIASLFGFKDWQVNRKDLIKRFRNYWIANDLVDKSNPKFIKVLKDHRLFKILGRPVIQKNELIKICWESKLIQIRNNQHLLDSIQKESVQTSKLPKYLQENESENNRNNKKNNLIKNLKIFEDENISLNRWIPDSNIQSNRFGFLNTENQEDVGFPQVKLCTNKNEENSDEDGELELIINKYFKEDSSVN